MILLLSLLPCAQAEPVGYYHPQELMAQSELYQQVAAYSIEGWEKAQVGAAALAKSLRDYEATLDLVGDLAPESERERLDTLTKEYYRSVALLQADFSGIVEAVDLAFIAALERHMPEGEVTKCQNRSAGPRLTRGGSSEEVTCEGTDLNPTIARAMDADEDLKVQVQRILNTPVPTISFDTTPVAPIGDGKTTVNPLDLLQLGAPEALSAIDDADSDARVDINMALEQGPSEAELESLRTQEETITATTASWRRTLAAPVFTAVEKDAKKWAKMGQPELSWCLQPELLGGCVRAPLSSGSLQTLAELPKVRKSLQKASEWRPPQD